MFLLAFYATFALLALASPVVVFKILRKRGVAKALFAASLTLGAAFLGFPILVHGGFTFPLEVMLQELRSERLQGAPSDGQKARTKFVERMSRRFTAPLVFVDRQPLAEPWWSVVTTAGTRGLFDARSGLAWTDPLPLEGTAPLSIESAKAFCARIEPAGHWSLPTEAELSLFWRAGGYRLSPLRGYGTAGLLENVELQTETLSVRINRGGAYALRCVALGPGAPASGYLSADIPLEDWNAYQVRKSSPGFPDS